MRAKMTGIFMLGFATGVAVLTGTLWVSGALKIPAVEAGTPRPVAPPPAAVVEPAHPTAAEPVPISSGADPIAPHLAMPLAGVEPTHLVDTFNDARDGHKHEALDIPAARGTPVLAVAEGNVVKLFTSKQGGLTVYQFDNSRTFSYYYAHLDRYAAGLKEGMLLRPGDVLGYVGSTGNASPTAPHLHFAVNRLLPDKRWWEGTPIDPLPLLL
jgi:murein DD-endopeptidase MepM/ murein hydrolase activator NlpD